MNIIVFTPQYKRNLLWESMSSFSKIVSKLISNTYITFAGRGNLRMNEGVLPGGYWCTYSDYIKPRIHFNTLLRCRLVQDSAVVIWTNVRANLNLISFTDKWYQITLGSGIYVLAHLLISRHFSKGYSSTDRPYFRP